MRPPNWNAASAVRRCRALPWRGAVWRFHDRAYPASDPAGSLKYPGRYHRGWPVLYTALQPEIAIGEFLRHVTPSSVHRLASMRLTELSVELNVVLDCRDASVLGLEPEDLLRDLDLDLTQAIGAAALARDVEGLLVPTATRLGGDASGNLVIFTSQLRADSRVAEVGYVDPRLYVPRP